MKNENFRAENSLDDEVLHVLLPEVHGPHLVPNLGIALLSSVLKAALIVTAARRALVVRCLRCTKQTS